MPAPWAVLMGNPGPRKLVTQSQAVTQTDPAPWWSPATTVQQLCTKGVNSKCPITTHTGTSSQTTLTKLVPAQPEGEESKTERTMSWKWPQWPCQGVPPPPFPLGILTLHSARLFLPQGLPAGPTRLCRAQGESVKVIFPTLCSRDLQGRGDRREGRGPGGWHSDSSLSWSQRAGLRLGPINLPSPARLQGRCGLWRQGGDRKSCIC